METQTPRFSRRVADLRPEGAYSMLARAQELEAQGRSIIHMEVGQPDIETFTHIRMRGIRAIEEGHTRYNPPAGLRDLRQVIAAEAGSRRGMEIRPEQVLVGPGAKPGLFFPTLALIEPGDEVIYPDPGFPTYPAMIAVAGGRPVPVPLREENSFSFDLEVFDRLVSPRTRLIILNSPANPTGGVMPLADLEHIAAAARERDCWVISDEIYARLSYTGRSVPSIAALPGMAERTVIVDGFSKTYAMTGWRLGYAIMPEALADRVNLLLTHSIGCTATFTQIAGIEALTGSQEEVDVMIHEYQRRRDRLVNGLNSLPGVRCQLPEGAFYAFPNVKSLGEPVRQLADRLLEQAGVAVLPGTDFGRYGEGYLRLSYATSVEQIEIALERMGAVLR
ncbi:MAG TPA: pyridoxal phosphate-dependent aminotransferase [Anaerolineales bacterium]|nr:pyridoxal phosphate-dependent aminotransferase [Anaerolineales bacterium]